MARRITSKTIKEAPLSPRATATVGLAAAVFLAVAVGAILWTGGSPEDYFRDIAAVVGVSPFTGAISTFGVLILVSAGVACIFSACHAPREGALLAFAGAFSLLIAADDLLMLHEWVMPGLGVPEFAVIGFYGVLALTFIAIFGRAVSGGAHVGLYTAVAFLAGSVLFDLAVEHSPNAVVVEDSLKFTGLAVWAAYWIGRAHRALHSASASDERASAPGVRGAE